MSDVKIELKQQLRGHRKPITAICFSPLENQFATISGENGISLWKIGDDKQHLHLKGHSDPITDIDYAPDGQLLASCSEDQTVRIWMTRTNDKTVVFRAHELAVRTVAFNRKHQVITGGDDKTLNLHDPHTKCCLSKLRGHNQPISHAKFIGNDTTVASSSNDHTVKIWDLKANQTVHTYSFRTNPTALSMDSTGNFLTVAMASGSVRLYDIRTHELQQHYTLHDATTGVSWHPKLPYFLSAGHDGKVKLVDVLQARPIYTLAGQLNSNLRVCFSREGDCFASGGADCVIKVNNLIRSELCTLFVF